MDQLPDGFWYRGLGRGLERGGREGRELWGRSKVGGRRERGRERRCLRLRKKGWRLGGWFGSLEGGEGGEDCTDLEVVDLCGLFHMCI